MPLLVVATSLTAPTAAVAQQAVRSSVFVLDVPPETYSAAAGPSAEVRMAVARRFYSQNSDAYDFLIVFPAFATTFGTEAAGDVAGLHYGVRNDVRGIGQRVFDNGAQYGSARRLKGYVDVGTLRPGAPDASVDAAVQIVAHEVAHQWSGRVGGALAGRDDAHWSFFFDSDASVMYGADWRDNGDGTYTAVDSRRRYSELDLYLMGLLSADEVRPLTVLTPAAGVTYAATDLPPPAGTVVQASATSSPFSAFLSTLGAREPAASLAQKDFRAAFVLLVPSGQSASPAQLEYVKSVRNAWANQFFFLTQGRAVMETALVDQPLPDFSALPGISAGLNYLLGAQREDGRWEDAPETATRDTEAVLSALALFDDESVDAPGAHAVNFLSGLSPADTDGRARRLRALVRAHVPDLTARQELVADPDPIGLRQREGRGFTSGYGATVLDTALVSLALSEGEDTDAVLDEYTEYFLERQNADGGWPALDRGTSRVEATALVLQFLARRTRTDLVAHAAGAALTFLEVHQGSGGFFVDGDSLPSTTAEVLEAAAAWGVLGSSGTFQLDALAESLRLHQVADGSWEGSAYETARALQVLRLLSSPNLTVRSSDVMLSAATTVEGQGVFADVRVRNEGLAASAPSWVQAFDSERRPFGPPVQLPAIAQGATTTVRLTLDTLGHGGSSQVFFVVDPEGLLDETREDDNFVALPLTVEPAPAGVELYALAGSVQAAPAVITRLPQGLTVSAVVGNSGLTAASNVPVILVVNDVVVGARTIELGPQSSATVTFPYEVQGGPFPLQMHMMVDPEGAIAESREDNNRAELSVPALSTVDLAVEALALSPNPVDPGQDVVVTLDVRNRGTVDAVGTEARAKVLVQDGTVVATLSPATLLVSAGGSARATLLWRARVSGALRVAATAVHPGEVAPGDNAAEASLTVNASSLPNLALVVGALTTSPTEPLVGQPSTALARVSNSADAVAGPFSVDFFWGNPDAGGVRFGSVLVDGLEAGGTVTASVPFTSTSAEARQLVVRVDPTSSVTEFDESDNDAVLTVTPLPVADLVLTDADIALSNPFPKAGDAVTVTASVYNRGRQPSTDTEVDFYLGGAPGAGGRLLGTRPLAALEPLTRESVSVTWTAESLNGPQVLVAVVNARSTSPEQRADNNRGERQVLVQSGRVAVSEPYFSPNGDGVKDGTTVYFQLAEPGPALAYVIGPEGVPVRQLEMLPTEAALGTVDWDGKDADGKVAPDGTYTLAVYAGAEGEQGLVGTADVALDTNRFPIEKVTDSALQRQVYLDAELPADLPVSGEFQPLHDGSGVYFFSPGLQSGSATVRKCGFYALPLTGGDPILLTPEDWNCSWGGYYWEEGYGWPEQYAMAPDGSAIAFVRSVSGYSWYGNVRMQLVLYSLRTRTFTVLATDDRNRYDLIGNLPIRFSADSQRVLFLARIYWSYSGWFGQHVASIDVGSLARRTEDVDLDGNAYRDYHGSVQSFRYSPKSGRIAYLYQDHYPDTECVVPIGYTDYYSEEVCTRSSSATPVPQPQYEWSADGQRLLMTYSTDATDKTNPLSVVFGFYDVPTRSLQRVLAAVDPARTLYFAPSPSGDAAVLSPSAGEVAGIQAGGLGVMQSVASGQVRPFVQVPGAQALGALRWSPQGTFILGNPSFPAAGGSASSTTRPWALTSVANLYAKLRASRPPGSAAISLRGTAADVNLESYSLAVREFGSTAEPTVITQRERSVVDGVLATWTPPRPGLYEVVLLVKDRAGNSARRTTRVVWSEASAIANLDVQPEFFSPNGDGTLETASVRYEATSPITTQFHITSSSGSVVRTVDRTHLQSEASSFLWDGRSDSGDRVADGAYTVTAERVGTGVVVDTTPPVRELAYGSSAKVGQVQPILTSAVVPAVTESGDTAVVPTLKAGMGWSVADANLKDWRLEAITGAQSQVLEAGGTPGPASLQVPVERLRGAQVRLTASDRAGNTAESVLPALDERLFLTGVGEAALLEGDPILYEGQRLPRIDKLERVEHLVLGDATGTVPFGGATFAPRSFSFTPQRYAFSLASTVREPIVSYAVAYPSPITGGQVVDTSNVTMLAEGVFIWDARHLPADHDFSLTLLATDAKGRVFSTEIWFSRKVALKGCTTFPAGEEQTNIWFAQDDPSDGEKLDTGTVLEFYADGLAAPELVYPFSGDWQRDPGSGATGYSAGVRTSSLRRCEYDVVLKGKRRNGNRVDGEVHLNLCGLIPDSQRPDGAGMKLTLAETFRQPVKSVDVYVQHGEHATTVEYAGTVPGFSGSTEVVVPSAGCGTKVHFVAHLADGAQYDSRRASEVGFNPCWPPGQEVCRSLSVAAARDQAPVPLCTYPSDTPWGVTVKARSDVVGGLRGLTASLSTDVGASLGELPLTTSVAEDGEWLGVGRTGTATLPEGVVTVRAEMQETAGGAYYVVSKIHESIIVDHTPVQFGVSSPASGGQFCAVKEVRTDGTQGARYDFSGFIADDWLDEAGLELRRTQDAATITVPLVSQSPKRTVLNGTLASLPAESLIPGAYELTGYARDASGGSVCLERRTFVVNDGLKLDALSASARAFSPNGDGVLDSVKLAYFVDAPASVEVSAVSAGGTYLLKSAATTAEGYQSWTWTGRSASGAVMPDGEYLVEVLAMDQCGATSKQQVPVRLDTTPPVARIDAPLAGAGVGAMFEVLGEATDRSFERYEVLLGSDSSPGTFISVATSSSATRGVLAVVDGSDLPTGLYTLKLVTEDAVGLRSESQEQVQVTAGQQLLAGFGAAPSIISPNGDGRRDSASATVALRQSAEVEVRLVRAGIEPRVLYGPQPLAVGTHPLTLDSAALRDAPEGDYQVEVVARADGVVESATASLTLDVTPPELAVSVPGEGRFVAGRGTVSGLVADAHLTGWTLVQPGALGEVEVARGVEPESGSLAFLEDLADGPHRLVLRAEDAAGNVRSVTRDFTSDSAAPRVAFIAPLANSYVTGAMDSLAVSASLDEATLQEVRLELERTGAATRTLFSTAAAGSTVSTSWPVMAEADGPVTLVWRATDKAGNEGQARVALTVDNAAPVAQLYDFPNGYLKLPARFSGVAQDARLEEWTLEIAPGALETPHVFTEVARGSVSVAGGVLYEAPLLPADGVYTARLKAKDRAGNRSEDVAAFVVDTTAPPPPLALVAHLQGTRKVELQWTGSAAEDLAGYRIYRATGSGLLASLQGELVQGTTFLDTTPVDGPYRYAVVAVDKAGLESSRSNEVRVSVDTQPPVAALTRPQPQAQVAGAVEFVGSAHAPDDFREYTLSLGEGAAPSTFTTFVRSPVAVLGGSLGVLDTSVLTQGGVYTVLLEAFDLDGNFAEARVTFSVDNQRPARPQLLAATPQGQDVSVSWQPVPDQDLAGYLLLRNGALVNAPAGASLDDLSRYLLPANTTAYVELGVPDGDHTWELQAVDMAGNLSERSNPLSLHLDRNTPRAQIITPASMARLAGAATVAAEVRDQDVARVQFEVRAGAETSFRPLGGPLERFPYTVQLDPAAFASAAIEVRAVATDRSGNTDASPASAYYFRDATPQPPVVDVQMGGLTPTIRWTDANPAGTVAGYTVRRAGAVVGTTTAPLPVGTASASSTGVGTPQDAYDGDWNTRWESAGGAPQRWQVEFSTPTLLQGFKTEPTQYATLDAFVKVRGLWVRVARGLQAENTQVTLDLPLEAEGIAYEFTASPNGRVGLAATYLTRVPLVASSPLTNRQELQGTASFSVTAVTPFGLSAAGQTGATGYVPYLNWIPDTVYLPQLTVTGSGAPPTGRVEVLREGEVVGEALASADGTFSVGTTLVAGTNRLRARVHYGIDSVSALSTERVVAYAPPPPVSLTLALLEQSGADARFAFDMEGDATRIGRFEVRREAQGLSTTIANLLPSERAFTDIGLRNGTYTYRVVAIATDGAASAPSNPVVLEVQVPPLPGPESLWVSNPQTGQRLDVAWSPVSGAQGYLVERALSADGPFYSRTWQPLTGTVYTDTSVSDGVTYFYRAIAVDARGERGVPSPVASGVSTEPTVPDAPVLLQPTTAGAPVEVASAQTDVSGLAEAQAQVELFANGRSVGKVRAGGAQLVYTPLGLSLTPYNYGYPKLSADGQVVAYQVPGTGGDTIFRAVAVEDLSTRALHVLPNPGVQLNDLFLSPDGTRVAVTGYRPRGSAWDFVTFVGDVQEGAWQELALSPSRVVTALAFSSDGSRIAYQASGPDNRLGVFALTTGTDQELWSSQYDRPSFPVWLDGERVAAIVESGYYSSSRLVEWTLGPVPTARDVYFAKYMRRTVLTPSADGRQVLLSAEQSDWVERLQLVDVATGSARPLTSRYAVATPVFSPDMSQVALSYGSSLWIINLASGELKEIGYLSSGSLVWRHDGLLRVTDGQLARIHWGGPFVFKDVPLGLGTTHFVAYTLDDSGNRSAGSAPIDVIRNVERLPDLVVSASVQPALPVVGKPANAVIVVKNAGGSAASGVKLSVSVVGADGSIRPAPAVSLAGTIGPGESRTTLVPLSLDGLVGEQQLVAVVDPERLVEDQDRDNNHTTVPFFIGTSDTVAASVSLTPSSVSPGQTSRATITLLNPGAPQDVDVSVSLLAEDGQVVHALGADELFRPLDAGASASFIREVDLTGLLAGTYQVQARVKSGGAVLTTVSAPLEYVPDAQVGLALEASRARYAPGEAVELTSRVVNRSANTLLEGASLHVEVVGPEGSVVYERTGSVPLLSLGGSQVQTLEVASLGAGAHVARASLTRAGMQLAYAATPFEVEGRPLLVGEVGLVGGTGEPPTLASGNIGALGAAVSNTGTAAAEELEVVLRVVEPETLTAVREQVVPVGVLGPGASWTNYVPLDSAGLKLQTYAVSLTARSTGSPETSLATARVRITDGQPPRIVSTNLVSGMFVRGAVSVQARVVDDSAGVRAVRARADGAADVALALSEGTTRDGTWVGTVSVGADGPHVLTLVAADADGNDGQASPGVGNPIQVQVVSDTLRPAIRIRGVADGTLSGEPVTPEVEVTDAHLVEALVTLDGAPYTSGTTVTADGEHWLEVRARDAADNRASASVHFSIDSSAPRITITGVSEGQLAQGPLMPRVYVSEANLESQTVTLDSVAFTSGSSVSAEGTHLLLVEARDTAGHVARSSVSFTIDRTPPVIVLGGVQEGQLSGTPLVPTFSATDTHLLATDATLDGAYFDSGTLVVQDGQHLLRVVALDEAGNSATAEVAFVIDSTPPVLAVTGLETDGVSADPVTPLISATDANLTEQWATLNDVPFLSGDTVAAEGEYVLRVYARDGAGNEATLVRAFAVDLTPPQVALGDFTDGECRAGDVTVRFGAEDAHLRSLVGRLDDADITSGTLVSAEGTHAVRVSAVDAADREAVRTGRFTIDRTAPLIEVAGVEQGRVYPEPVAAAVSFTDANLSASTVTLDGKPYVTGTAIGAEGGHTLAVTASDCAGNPARLTREFAIDTVPPAIAVEGVVEAGVYSGDVTPEFHITEDNLARSSATLDGQPFTSGTVVSAEGTHVLMVEAADSAGHEARTEVRFTLQRMKVTVEKRLASGFPRALALLRAGTCAMDPAEVERLSAFLGQQLAQAGGTLQVTTTEAAFQAALRSGVHNLFILVSQGHDEVVCDEDRPSNPEEARLRRAIASAATERVFAGAAGVLAVRTRVSDWPGYREVLGADVLGMVDGAQAEATAVPLAPLDGFTAETRAVRLDLLGAQASARYLVPAQGAAAATASTLGAGRSVMLGFDPSRTQPASAGTTAFSRALAWTTPPAEASAPLGVAAVEVQLSGQTEGTPLQVREELVGGLSALEALPSATISGDRLNLEWAVPAVDGETRVLRYLARLPDVPGVYPTRTEVSAQTATGLRLLESRTLSLEVSESGGRLLSDALATANALPSSGNDRAVRARIERLLTQVQQRSAIDAAGVEANLDDLYAAVDEAKSLRSVSPVQMRLAVDQLIRYWEARWSAL